MNQIRVRRLLMDSIGYIKIEKEEAEQKEQEARVRENEKKEMNRENNLDISCDLRGRGGRTIQPPLQASIQLPLVHSSTLTLLLIPQSGLPSNIPPISIPTSMTLIKRKIVFSRHHKSFPKTTPY
jgi:hypothetical protein